MWMVNWCDEDTAECLWEDKNTMEDLAEPQGVVCHDVESAKAMAVKELHDVFGDDSESGFPEDGTWRLEKQDDDEETWVFADLLCLIARKIVPID